MTPEQEILWFSLSEFHGLDPSRSVSMDDILIKNEALLGSGKKEPIFCTVGSDLSLEGFFPCWASLRSSSISVHVSIFLLELN